MARLMDRPVDTFTIGFQEPGFDETVHSRAAAARFAVRRHEEIIGADSLDVLDDVVAGFGQPFADPSAVPTLLVSRLARREVTVALSGDGGDELFGGYTRYALARSQQWYDLIPRRLRATLAATWPGNLRGAGMLRIAAEPFAARYLDNNALTTPGDRSALLAPELAQAASANPFRLAEPLVRELQARLGSIEDLLLLDLHSYLADVILAKVDRMSMRCSLEARVPLLDHVLVETVSSLPLAWRMGRRGSKQLLREAFADLYPPAIRKRGKMGFGVPLGAWLAGPLAERLRRLPQAEAVRHGPLQAAGVQRLVAEHAAGARDRGRKLWALMVFAAWWARRSSRRPAGVAAGGAA
jgi:asparagine synthase (glutamine-hydrolysing)